MIGHISISSWIGDANSITCVARPSGAALSFSLLYGALWTKTYRINGWVDR